jgi:uncharacterized protein YecE (DUF72 family)
MRKFRISLVLHDKPGSASPMIEQEQEFVYLRFHGPDGDYKCSYNHDFMIEYAGYIKYWNEEGKTVYVYFNNTIGDAIRNLQSLNRHLRSISIPAF